VVEVAVRLDHQLLAAPEEVDEVAADPNVDLGARQRVASAELQEVALQIAAGAVPLLGAKRKPADLGLASRATQFTLWEDATEVGDGAGRRGDGNAVTEGDVGSSQRAGAVNRYPPSLLSSARAPSEAALR
jgi:hypothetical protein